MLYSIPPLPVPMFGFCQKFCQKVASVQLGIMYGNTKMEEMIFLPFMLVRVMKKATIPPYTMAITLARIDMRMELSSGFQKYTVLTSDAKRRCHQSPVVCPIMTPYAVS